MLLLSKLFHSVYKVNSSRVCRYLSYKKRQKQGNIIYCVTDLPAAHTSNDILTSFHVLSKGMYLLSVPVVFTALIELLGVLSPQLCSGI